MSLPLDFHPLVQGEIDDAHRWYEGRQPGLGADFLDEVQRVLDEIVANPARYGFALGDVREGLVARFPYSVYYRALAGRIRILAVHHAAMNPTRWRSRV